VKLRESISTTNLGTIIFDLDDARHLVVGVLRHQIHGCGSVTILRSGSRKGLDHCRPATSERPERIAKSDIVSLREQLFVQPWIAV
jgi:hypothetical protein